MIVSAAKIVKKDFDGVDWREWGDNQVDGLRPEFLSINVIL